jgi:hypothetical protein
MIMRTNISVEKITIKILLILGITIPLVQFLCNRSIWVDEAMLALNIIHKDYFELLKPLDYNQVAPIFFLEIEKFFSTLIPNSEYGLRLFPLLCFWAALFFFFRIVKMVFNNRLATIFALSLFVFNITLIYYSSEVKQYISDVMVYTAIVYFVLKNYKNNQTKFYILGIAGILTVFLSNVAPIILSVAGLYLLYEQFCIKKTKNNITGLVVVFAVWLSVFAVYYYFFIFNHPIKDFMLHSWSAYEGFLPFDSLSRFVRFFVHSAGSVLLNFSRLIPLIVLIAILFITGIFSIIREKKIGLVIITCFPVVIHLLLSGLHLYPFAPRLILYIMPSLMIICTAGFTYMITWLSPFLKPVNFRLFCFIPIIFLFSFTEFPIKYNVIPYSEDIKEDLKYLKENVKDDEAIYVLNSFCGYTFQYYLDIGLVDFEIPVIIDTENFWQIWQTPKPLDNDMKTLKKIHGNCWLIFDYGELSEEYIINYFDSIGYKNVRKAKIPGSIIHIYNFR